jgi:threonine/homoserine/homoserine lactone efflux protein
MTEYQILNIMHVGFIQNAMYFVGMVLMTWLAFRMCNNVRNNPNTNMTGKAFTSIFCVFVALFMTQTNAIGGSILTSSVNSLVDVGAASAERMSAYLSSPMIIGGPVQKVFVLFILVFQLALVWTKE